MKRTIPNWVAGRGLSALMFAASVEMLRQAAGAETPRGSTALIIAMRCLVADSLERKP